MRLIGLFAKLLYLRSPGGTKVVILVARPPGSKLPGPNTDIQQVGFVGNNTGAQVGQMLVEIGRLLSGETEPPANQLQEWIGEFLNRRSEVEKVLRAPMDAKKRGGEAPDAMWAEEMWELANRLTVPDEFQPQG